MTTLSITEILMNGYASITFLVDNSYPKTEIDSTLSDYTISAQLHTDLYSKVKTNLIFDTYTTTTQLYDDLYSKLYIDNMFLIPTQTGSLYYNKTNICNLWVTKISGIGDVLIQGMLDIGTSGYTDPRIRCNAKLNGYTGYAEIRAASSYDMF